MKTKWYTSKCTDEPTYKLQCNYCCDLPEKKKERNVFVKTRDDLNNLLHSEIAKFLKTCPYFIKSEADFSTFSLHYFHTCNNLIFHIFMSQTYILLSCFFSYFFSILMAYTVIEAQTCLISCIQNL